MIVLGIDTSCDETSASILKDGNVLSNIIYSQFIHKKFGGVVPSLASKDHEKNISTVVSEAINVSKIDINDIDAIAVTNCPGLISCLLVGLNFAKGFAIGLNIPIISINHLEGHLCSTLINSKLPKYPYLCLLVSGGHTQIWCVENCNNYKILSTTVDDAVGEAFDKGAKMLGLQYPGGPEIEKYSEGGNPSKYKFSIPKLKKNPLNFSFSGIKTALYYLIKNNNDDYIKENFNHICASYQEALINILFFKLVDVLKNKNMKNISIVGGVSCNSRFRLKALEFEKKYNVKIDFPKMEFCTDNGAMIAMAAYLQLKNNSKVKSNFSELPIPNLKF